MAALPSRALLALLAGRVFCAVGRADPFASWRSHMDEYVRFYAAALARC